MEGKAKLGWGVLRILGAIYTLLGGPFFVLGLVFLALLPNEIRLMGMLFSVIGGLFLLLGLIFLAIEQVRQRRINALVEAGHFVWAEVVDSVLNYSIRVNHSHPSRLVVCYTDGRGVKHLFKSRNIRSFGTKALIGKTVRVYTDPGFRHYYVDVEPLLGGIVEH